MLGLNDTQEGVLNLRGNEHQGMVQEIVDFFRHGFDAGGAMFIEAVARVAATKRVVILAKCAPHASRCITGYGVSIGLVLIPSDRNLFYH